MKNEKTRLDEEKLDAATGGTAPELPATVLGENAYASMFSGSESLTAAPELPATHDPGTFNK